MATDTKVKQCLKKFGFEKFRSDIQEKAILSIIHGNSDVFISFPTGAGKSLCYQFPAVYKEDGLSIVISPLLALIQDQVTALNEKNIVARTLNSTLSQQEKKIVLGDLMQRQPTTRLLYITPELASTQSFLSIIKKVHQRKLVNYLIIDEAHCVSQWGHDYRPDYLKLGTLHDELSNVPCIAVTATASQQVIDDIYSSLHLRKPVLEFKSSVFRPNLFYDIQFKELIDDPFMDLCQFIDEIKKITNTQSNSGIIYCRTRDSCSDLASKLTQTGKYGPVKAYHAGLTNEKRKQIQDDWMNGSISIICATISFGMGIDKGDVRFVVHWDLAKSISGYYQESGRAGRDGQRSHCRMYYSARERDTQLFLINQEINDKKIADEQKTSMLNGFNALVQYCEEAKCRHLVIGNYFGDMSMKPCETMCDACTQRDIVAVNLQNLKKKKFDETINRRSANRIMYRNEGSEEQYEGGRLGNRRDEREYRNTDEDYRRDDDNDDVESAKLATKLVYNELKRRGAMEVKPKAWTAASANCPLIDPSSRKIPNVTVQLREHVCRKLKEALIENIEKHFANDEQQRITHEATCLEKAVWLEHQVFLATKSEPMYKMKYMSKCNEITKATKNDASLYIVESMPTNINADSSSSPTSSKRKLSETESNSLSNEPDTKMFKQNGHTDNEVQSSQQQQDKSNPLSLSPITTENKSPNRKRSVSASSTSSSSSSSSSSSDNSSTSSSSSSSATSSSSSKASSSKIKLDTNTNINNNNNDIAKPATLKRPNGETTNDKKKSKLFDHSLSTLSNKPKLQSTSPRHRRKSLPIPSTSDVKAKEARGTLKTCLESMSNFLHQKLNEQSSSHLTIQSPNEEPIPPQGSSSPSFLNDQQQQGLQSSRNTSLDERIRSLFTNTSNEDKTVKNIPKPNIRKSLPMPPGTFKSKDEHKHPSPKKRSSSLGGNGKVTNKKLSSSSIQTKHSSSSSSQKSSTKKIRDSKLPVNIKTISEVVVDVLNPFYQANRFSSKELFKTLAKRISQHLASKEFSNIDAVRMDAKSLIKPAFRHKHSKILTHADLDRIVPA